MPLDLLRARTLLPGDTNVHAAGIASPGDIANLVLDINPLQQYVEGGGARQFTAASSQYFTTADNATHSTGDVDFWLAAWVYSDGFTGFQNIIAKYANSGGNNEYILRRNTTGPISFLARNSADSAWTTVNTGTTPVDDVWYFVLAWHDATNDIIGIRLNDGDVVNGTHSGGLPDSGAAFIIGADGTIANFWDGRIALAAMGKPPATIADQIGDISKTLWNAGRGTGFAGLTAAQKTAWGLTAGNGAWYELNEASGNAIDAVSTLDLTDTATVTAAAGPGAGKSRDYESTSNQYHAVADHTDLRMGTSDFSINMWVKREALGATIGLFADYNDGASEAGFDISFPTGNTIRVRLDDGSTLTAFASVTTIADTDWHMLTLTFDRDDVLKYYLDGVDLSEDDDISAFSSADFSDDATKVLGTDKSRTNEFDGLLARTSLWKGRILTAADVTALYNGGDGLAYKDLTAALKTSMVGHWDGDEDSGDIQDQANAVRHLELSNNEDFTVADHADLRMGTGDFTINVWLRREDNATNHGVFNDYDDTAGEAGIRCHITAGGRITVILDNGSSTTTFQSLANIVDDTNWHMITLTFDRNGDLTYYDDGSSVETDDISAFDGVDFNSTDIKTIGSTLGGIEFDGDMSCFTIWKNRLLSPAEVTTLYNSGSRQKYADLSAALQTSIVASWDLDETTDGADAVDSSGNGHTGTATSDIAGIGPTTSGFHRGTDTNTVGTGAGMEQPYLDDVVSGDPIQQLEDAQNSGDFFVQNTAAKRPLWVDSVMAGEPVLRFDGSDDLLVRTVADYRSGDSAGTMVIVHNTTAAVAGQVWLAASDEGTATSYLLFVSNSSEQAEVNQQNAADTADGVRGGTVMSGITVTMIISTGTAYSLYVDGNNETETVTGGANNGDWFADTTLMDNVSIGAWKSSSEASHANTDIGRILLYSRELTMSEIVDLGNFLANKYGAPASW